MEYEFTDRYKATGTPYPNVQTMCKGQCEGMGVVPHHKGNAEVRPLKTEQDDIYDKLWDEAEKIKPSEDGWHFVKCPDCGGTGKVLQPK